MEDLSKSQRGLRRSHCSGMRRDFFQGVVDGVEDHAGGVVVAGLAEGDAGRRDPGQRAALDRRLGCVTEEDCDVNHAVLIRGSIGAKMSGHRGGKGRFRGSLQCSAAHLFGHLGADRANAGVLQIRLRHVQPFHLARVPINNRRATEMVRNPRDRAQEG